MYQKKTTTQVREIKLHKIDMELFDKKIDLMGFIKVRCLMKTLVPLVLAGSIYIMTHACSSKTSRPFFVNESRSIPKRVMAGDLYNKQRQRLCWKSETDCRSTGCPVSSWSLILNHRSAAHQLRGDYLYQSLILGLGANIGTMLQRKQGYYIVSIQIF